MNAKLIDHITGCRETVVELQRALTAIPALGPENGGQGESVKAEFIIERLRHMGVERIKMFQAPDDRVQCGFRPNLVAELPGLEPESLCLFGHMDVVPPGDPGLWRSDPWQLRVDGDFVYGRGVEDNQQAIVSMLILAESLLALDIRPRIGLKLFFLADEECGSRKGLIWLLKEQPQLFSPNDIYIVPDGGSVDGSEIEVAEKAQMWLKFTVIGRQCHASAPQDGINAFVAASDLVLRLERLHEYFPDKNPLFAPSFSTFVPTRHDANVSGINILPGQDVFYLDCRILPDTPLNSVLSGIRGICSDVEMARDVKIDVEIVQTQPASAIPADSSIVDLLKRAIGEIYQVQGRPVGIGGATVAAMLRQRGLPAAVWSKIQNTCHQPNERSSISAACSDAAVFACMLE